MAQNSERSHGLDTEQYKTYLLHFSFLVSVDCGTEEGVVSPRQRDHIDIMFHSKLSYAEKLLLKKHRRGQLVDQSPAYSASETQLRLSTGHSSDVTPSPSGNFLNSRDETQTSKKHSTPNVLKLLIGECIWRVTSEQHYVNSTQARSLNYF